VTGNTFFRLWRQTRSNCGTTRRAIGLFWRATSAYGLLRTCAAGLTARASAGIAEVSAKSTGTQSYFILNWPAG
jgi:hypothetical protein